MQVTPDIFKTIQKISKQLKTGESVSLKDGKIIINAAPKTRILALEKEGHIDLLESIADRIVDCCFADERVHACAVAIRKPDIFPEAQGAGVDVFRTRDGWFKAT